VPRVTARTRRRLVAAVLLTIAATTAVACGSSEPTPNSTSPRSDSESAGSTLDPGVKAEITRVALTFTKHSLDDKAARLVAPDSKKAFAILQAAAPPGLRTTTSSLDIGAVTVRGSRATAVVTGTWCKTDDDHPKQCLTNEDPRSTDPTFTVNLVEAGGAWMVTFPRPSGTQSSTTSCSENGVETAC
jgi:hypothetical protein